MDSAAPLIADDLETLMKAQGLRYVSDTRPGFTRRKGGTHFQFFDTDGAHITDEAIIARIRKLAIPPAYQRVWICPHANGHVQATGYDARGRKQYRYHADWRAMRDANKFNHILAFAEILPVIRAQVKDHLSQRGHNREKVLACVVSLLEKTLIRVGNDEYARANQSYGLTTLKDEHVDITGSTIRFKFRGKSGKDWNLKLSDRRLARVINDCADIDGQELFKYRHEDGSIRDVTSGDVNQYLREITGGEFTAKDFRTWTGTVLAALALREYAEYDGEAQISETMAKKNVIAAIDRVSKSLGNTPAICRKCYVHPEVVSAYMDGSLIKQINREINITLARKYEHLTPEEILVLAFLKKRLIT